jgi:hypothetical protein
MTSFKGFLVASRQIGGWEFSQGIARPPHQLS